MSSKPWEVHYGDDLSVYLLERGWAVALPNARVEYHAQEHIAQLHGMGIWDIAINQSQISPFK